MRKLTVGGVGAAAGAALLNQKAAASVNGGIYTALPTPYRIYDSRVKKYDDNGRSERSMKVGKIGVFPELDRKIYVMDGRDLDGEIIKPLVVPKEATAAQINLTIVNTETGEIAGSSTNGYLSLRAHSSAEALANSSLINWNTDGAILSNACTVALGAFPTEEGGIVGNAIDVIVGPVPDINGKGYVKSHYTDFLIDVFGYYSNVG